MYQEHSSFRTPSDEIVVWRYMDFTKFYSLISSDSLFFPSINKLISMDPFEGSYTKMDHSQSDEKKIKYWRHMRDKLRKTMFISSWYMNNYESAAMWRIYAGQGEGIAIRSSIKALKNCIKDNIEYPENTYLKTTFVGEIAYKDYDNDIIDTGNCFQPFLCKRKSFEHEKEVRIIKWEATNINTDKPIVLPDGLAFKVDLNELIDEIYVAPTTPDWILSLIKKLLKSKGLNKDVTRSLMNQEGIW